MKAKKPTLSKPFLPHITPSPSFSLHSPIDSPTFTPLWRIWGKRERGALLRSVVSVCGQDYGHVKKAHRRCCGAAAMALQAAYSGIPNESNTHSSTQPPVKLPHPQHHKNKKQKAENGGLRNPLESGATTLPQFRPVAKKVTCRGAARRDRGERAGV